MYVMAVRPLTGSFLITGLLLVPLRGRQKTTVLVWKVSKPSISSFKGFLRDSFLHSIRTKSTSGNCLVDELKFHTRRVVGRGIKRHTYTLVSDLTKGTSLREWEDSSLDLCSVNVMGRSV